MRRPQGLILVTSSVKNNRVELEETTIWSLTLLFAEQTLLHNPQISCHSYKTIERQQVNVQNEFYGTELVK